MKRPCSDEPAPENRPCQRANPVLHHLHQGRRDLLRLGRQFIDDLDGLDVGLDTRGWRGRGGILCYSEVAAVEVWLDAFDSWSK